jgi:hypothetical protein
MITSSVTPAKAGGQASGGIAVSRLGSRFRGNDDRWRKQR